jgi:hypothetical protein
MKKEKMVQKNLTLIYWKGKKYWLGKLVENPEIMSQGRTLKELVDYAKKNPGTVRFGLHGQGTIDHFDLELIKSLTGAQFTIVPFKGAAIKVVQHTHLPFVKRFMQLSG